MRVIAFVLSVSLLSGTAGISVYKHYCGDYLADISFFSNASSCFDMEGEASCEAKKEMSCCDDEHELYQLDIELQKHQAQSFSIDLASMFSPQLREVATIFDEAEELSIFSDRGPPLIPKVPFYIQNSRLTLYA